MRGRAALGAVAAAAALAVATTAPGAAPVAVAGAAGSPQGSTARPFDVVGFQSDGDPLQRIDASAAALTRVGVDGINLTGGAGVSTPGPADLAQLRRAHARGLRADLLVGNFSNRINDFSEPLAHGLLADATSRRGFADTLVGIVGPDRWDGITLDLESLRPRDRSGLVALLGLLRARLPAGVRLSVCLQNATSAPDFAAQGYDLRAIGRLADRVVLMAYDDHGPWEDTPGPVGPLSWQQAGLRVLLRAVPAARVQLGVAGYGYGWRPHANVQLSDADARTLAARSGVGPRWVPATGEWTATLADGSTLWWSDARSLRLRVAIARADRLAGVAVWSLGLSDPLTLG